jgi:hypothetical protein
MGGIFNYDITPEYLAINRQMSGKMSFAIFVRSVMEGFDEFWFNQYGFTPQQMADAYDVKCLQIFQEYNNTVQWIMATKPDALDQKYLSTPLPWNPELDVNNVPTGRITVG